MQFGGDLDLPHAIADWGQGLKCAERGVANHPCVFTERNAAQGFC